MWESTVFVAASTFVSIVGAFIHMTFSTSRALFAVAHRSKGSTSRCSGIDVDMSVGALGIGAIATNEMKASGNTMRGKVMRKVASFLTDYALAST